MIYTLTLNPAIDYNMELPQLKTGGVNRSAKEYIRYGGKGINVSAVLAQLGEDTEALGFIAGATGDRLEEGVRAMGVKTGFIKLKRGMTRINVKLHADTETEINAAGPEIDDAALGELYAKTDELRDGDTAVLAGSVPGSLPRDIYERIAERLSDRDIRIAADAEKELLTAVLKYRPFVVKPNIHELSAIFGVDIADIPAAEKYARELQKMGAKNVLVSMGGDGALLLDEDGDTHFRAAFSGRAVNTVGAGDSMLAGFLAGVGKGYEYALLLGTAAGAATAFSEGLADKRMIDELLERSGGDEI